MVLGPESTALGLLIFVHHSTHPSKLLQKTNTALCMLKYNHTIQTTASSKLAELCRKSKKQLAWLCPNVKT